MFQLIIRRLLVTIPMLLLVSGLAFGLLAVAPGDPARKALSVSGAGDQVDERDVAAKRRELGLDRPLWERYGLWLGNALTLDLGESYVSKRPVAELIGERLRASATLALAALALSVAIGVPLGVIAAIYAGTWLDALVRFLTLLGASLPGFWLALLAMWLFAVELQWLPALGGVSPKGIILPAAVLTVRALGLLTRLTRAAMLEALQGEYVRAARAKGLSERRLVVGHAFPNALVPILTIIGLDFTSLLAQATVIEWVFAWPGIGRQGVDAAIAGDVPVVLGFVLFVSTVVVLTNLTVDLSYIIVDPRLRPGSAV